MLKTLEDLNWQVFSEATFVSHYSKLSKFNPLLLDRKF